MYTYNPLGGIILILSSKGIFTWNLFLPFPPCRYGIKLNTKNQNIYPNVAHFIKWYWWLIGVECHLTQYFSYFWVISFIGRNQSTWRKYTPDASHWQTVLSLEIQLSRGRGWDSINGFNSATSLCLSNILQLRWIC